MSLSSAFMLCTFRADFRYTCAYNEAAAERYVPHFRSGGFALGAYANAIRNYFNFSGRTTRSGFWVYVLFQGLLIIVAAIVDSAVFAEGSEESGLIAGSVTVFHFIPSLAISVRRLHDVNRTGWWVLIGLIPLVGFVWLLVLFCQPSEEPTNERVVASRPKVSPNADSQGPIDDVERILKLYKSGQISEQEFAALKAKIMPQPSRF